MLRTVIIILALAYVVGKAISAFAARRNRTKESYDALLNEVKTTQAMLYRRIAQESFDERVQGYMQHGLHESDAKEMAGRIADYQRDLTPPE